MKFPMLAARAALIVVATGTIGAQTPSVAKSAKVSDGIYEVVTSPSQNTVWVATIGTRDKNNAAIYGLDPKTLDVRRTIDVAAAPAFGLGINDRTQTLYTSNTRSGSVSAIDLKTGKVVSTIKVESNPDAHLFKVLVDEDANKVYVSVAATPASVWVIDGKTNTLSHIIDSVGTRSTGLALDKANNRLFVASLGSNEILAVDLATNKVVSRIPAGGVRPTQMVFDAKSNRLFVTNQGTGDISVIDTKAGSVLRTVPTGAGALGLGFNADRNQIYVANRTAGTVTVIDGNTYAVVADLKAGTLPNTVAVDAKTGSVYVTNKARGAARGAAPTEDAGGDTVTLIVR